MIKAKPTIKIWRDEIRRITNDQLSQELSDGRKHHYDPTFISSVVNGEREPSKQLMKKFAFRMGADIGDIWTFDRNSFLNGPTEDDDK